MAASETIDPDAFNAFEAEGWKRRASGYHDFFASITTRATERLLDAARVDPGRRMLDVATGPGYVAAAAAARGATATGLDVAEEMVELAARLHPQAGFVLGDAERLPFEDSSFDAAVASFAILHLGRPERAAAELARVLTSGGRVAVSVWDAPERSRLMGVFVDAVAEAGASAPAEVPAGPDFFRFADDAALERLLAGAGFADAAVESIDFRHHLSGASELWEGMLSGTVRIRAMVDRQPAEARRRIRAAFDRLVAAHASDDAIEIPVRVKIGSARKP